MKRILFCLYVITLSAYADENILCLSSSCDDATCDDVPEECLAQNGTANGVFLLSPTICNCCDYCLVNIAEGDPCTVGDPASSRHTSICGPGLTCITPTSDDTDGTCQPMSTDCTNEQKEYDTRRQNGYLGTMQNRPSCDDDGLYASYRCVPGQTCYCQLANGTRIFGEADFSSLNSYMPCQCSRNYYDAVELIGRELHPDEHFRCTENGDYDTLQCIGEGCLCVDSSDGAPTYPTESLVNITLISNETLSCYNKTEVGDFYKQCELEYMEILKEVRTFKKEGFNMVLAYEFPKCDLDGSYKAVQENTTHKYCVDKEGSVLTAVNKTENATLAENMDCKCIRSINVMSTNEKPDCLLNGNYNPVQCRRGVCRCVDNNGNQVCSDPEAACDEFDESQVDSLSCKS